MKYKDLHRFAAIMNSRRMDHNGTFKKISCSHFKEDMKHVEKIKENKKRRERNGK